MDVPSLASDTEVHAGRYRPSHRRKDAEGDQCESQCTLPDQLSVRQGGLSVSELRILDIGCGKTLRAQLDSASSGRATAALRWPNSCLYRGYSRSLECSSKDWKIPLLGVTRSGGIPLLLPDVRSSLRLPQVMRKEWLQHASPDSLVMDAHMACGAECDQVLFRIVARVAAKLCVMNLQVRHRAARLTTPAITTQDLLPKILPRHEDFVHQCRGLSLRIRGSQCESGRPRRRNRYAHWEQVPEPGHRLRRLLLPQRRHGISRRGPRVRLRLPPAR